MTRVEEYAAELKGDSPVEETPQEKEKEETPKAEKMTMGLTPEQTHIANLIMSSDNEWETIREDQLTDYSLGDEPYPLPDEAKKRQERREFAFRWIENSGSRLEEVMRMDVPFRWWPCNSTNTPYLQKYIDRATGAIHCKDQILVFKPWWMHQKKKDIISGAEEARMGDASLEAKHRTKEPNGSEWTAGSDARVNEGRDVVMRVADDV